MLVTLPPTFETWLTCPNQLFLDFDGLSPKPGSTQRNAISISSSTTPIDGCSIYWCFRNFL